MDRHRFQTVNTGIPTDQCSFAFNSWQEKNIAFGRR